MQPTCFVKYQEKTTDSMNQAEQKSYNCSQNFRILIVSLQ